MKDLIKVMKALSDPSRVKILKMLQHKSMCVCEIKAALGVAQPMVSKHLKILEDANLVGGAQEWHVGQLLSGRWKHEPLCCHPFGESQTLSA